VTTLRIFLSRWENDGYLQQLGWYDLQLQSHRDVHTATETIFSRISDDHLWLQDYPTYKVMELLWNVGQLTEESHVTLRVNKYFRLRNSGASDCSRKHTCGRGQEYSIMFLYRSEAAHKCARETGD